MIETPRLRFRKFLPDDIDWLFELLSDAEVNRYFGGPQPRTGIEGYLKWYLYCYQNYGFGYCVMTRKDTNEDIGMAGLQPLENTGEIEVGYAMEKDHWGRGFATESCMAWLDYGFNELDLLRIVAVASPENTPSQHVMKKCGMAYEKNIFAYGHDNVMYSICRGEFPSSHKYRHET